MIAGGNHTTIHWLCLREQATQRLLKSPSFGTFLGEARKVHIRNLLLRNKSDKPISKEETI